MNYVESFNLLGVEAKQIPCIKGEGTPTTATEGAVGCLYMDTLVGTLYKCTAVSDGTYMWATFGGEKGDPGVDGTNGVIFTPHVSADGTLSWTNDGGLTNPEPVNIVGNAESIGEIVQTTGDSETSVMSQKATTDYVDNYLKNVPTKNLLNVSFKNAMINDNGVYAERTDGLRFAASPDFIKVDGGETYTFSYKVDGTNNATNLFVVEYDFDKTFLRKTKLGGLYTSPRIITVGSDCRYVGIALYTNTAGVAWETVIPPKFQMEKGSIATEYVLPSYNIVDKMAELENDLNVLEEEANSKILVIERNEKAIHNLNAASKYGYHKNGKKNQEKRFTAIITTDVHGDGTRLKNAIEILNNADAVDVGFCLGDVQGSDFSENDGSWYTDIINTSEKPFYTLLGNHDQKNYLEKSEILVGSGGTPSEAFAKFIHPTLGVLGQNITTPYYKVLNDTYKIAVICLNNYDTPVDKNEDGTFVIPRDGECISTEQLSWFINELNTIPNDYHLIIARHSNPSENQIVDNEWSQTSISHGSKSVYDDNNTIPDIVNAWINGTSFSKTYAPMSGYELCPTHNVNADFTSRGQGNFVCYLVGHSHKDVICESTLYKNQVIVGFCATAADNFQNQTSDLPRVRGARSEDAITAVTVDTTARKIRLVRFGSDITFDLVKRDITTIDY